MGTRFTDKFVATRKPAEKEYWVREGQGFALRVLPSGERVWYYIYTFEKRKRFMRIGTYPHVSLAEARDAFDTARTTVKSGGDPLTEKVQAAQERSSAPTVEDLITEYVEKHAKKFKKSWEADKRLLDVEVFPAWGKRKAQDITKRDVNLLLEGIVERGAPAMSNQVLKITRKMFNFAVERDILQQTPFIGVKALAPHTRRDRVLGEGEILAFWENISKCAISKEIQTALKLVLVTGQRPGEVAGMHTAEISGNWWTIPPERSKNKKEHRVYLTKMALDLIGPLTTTAEETDEITSRGFIFPCPHKNKAKPIDPHALPVAVRRNLECPLLDQKGKPLYKKNGDPATENLFGIDHFTPHDLRRTAATFMASMGYMDEIIDAVLNHVKQGIIRTYNRHRYDSEKQQALEAWERKLTSILG